MSSQELAAALAAVPGSDHQPSTLQLSTSALARLLAPLGIRARALRIGNHRARGYQLTDFAKAFAQFLD